MVLTVSLTSAVWADAPITGQHAFGQSTVEPAYDDATGNLIYLLTPNHAPFPSKANSVATAPMFIPMYPTNSTLTNFNCLPDNCDHLQVVPSPWVSFLGLTSVYPDGTFTGGLVSGHDHLVGVAKSGGDFNVAWHVYLVLFTDQGVSDGAINKRLVTLSDISSAVTAKDAVGPIDSGIVFNCSIVSQSVYQRGQ